MQDAAVFGATGGALVVRPAILGQTLDAGVEAVVLTMERNHDLAAGTVWLIDEPNRLDGRQPRDAFGMSNTNRPRPRIGAPKALAGGEGFASRPLSSTNVFSFKPAATSIAATQIT